MATKMADLSKQILILSSNTGGGHQSAASALKESFTRLSPAGQVLVNIAQVLEDANFLTHRLSDLYNYLLRYHQHYMKYYYWTIQRLRPYESHFIFQLCLKYGAELIERIRPTLLVSVHPMTQHFFVYLLKKFKLIDKIPLITVVTDPCAGFWRGWACPEVAQYFVASAEAKAQLVEYGVTEQRINVSGMPIHSRFKPVNSTEEKMFLRRELGLDPDRFTILINTGWVGGGNVPELYETLMSGGLGRNIQVIFLAGHNKLLYRYAQKAALNADFPVKIMEFTLDVDKLMNASDIMISKLGGLTTFEAMACHLPVLADCLTPPMPQEEGTAHFIESKGAGVLITEPCQVLEELEFIMNSPARYRHMQAAAASICSPGASDKIAADILTRLASV